MCTLVSYVISFAMLQCAANNQILEFVGYDPRKNDTLIVQCKEARLEFKGYIPESRRCENGPTK